MEVFDTLRGANPASAVGRELLVFTSHCPGGHRVKTLPLIPLLFTRVLPSLKSRGSVNQTAGACGHFPNWSGGHKLLEIYQNGHSHRKTISPSFLLFYAWHSMWIFFETIWKRSNPLAEYLSSTGKFWNRFSWVKYNLCQNVVIHQIGELATNY